MASADSAFALSRHPSNASFSTQYSFESRLVSSDGNETLIQSSESSSDESEVSGESEPPLGTEISRSLEDSVSDPSNPTFLPEGRIEQLITKVTVRDFLSYRCQESDLEKKLPKVLDHIFPRAGRGCGAKRLLAVVILVGLSGKDALLALHQFARSNIDDGCLPIRNPKESPGFWSKKRSKFYEPWNQVRIAIFCDSQWRVKAHVFTEEDSKRVLKLDANCILPIVSQSGAESAGAFGVVSRITLHKSHHIDPIQKYDGTRADVALKEIKLPAEQREWEREAEAHIKMREMNHAHIIEFIAAIEMADKRYLLFRWAEEGNLRNFWSNNKRPTLSSAFVRDVVHQIRGLADALNTMHGGKESFRHGDLKPENILCVTRIAPEAGRIHIPQLKISDLGLAKHHIVATGMRPPTSQRCTTTRYEPPEVFTSLPLHVAPGSVPGGRSRRYDMWSLGCVILETVIWLLFGNENLEKFNSGIVDENNQPNHWFQGKKKAGTRAMVHQHVRGAMATLLRDQECVNNTAIGDLVRIVKEKLLVVDLGATMTFERGGGNPDARPSSSPGCRVYSHELMASLDVVMKRCEEDEKYCFTGKSRDMIRNLVITPELEDIPEPSFLSPGDGLGPYGSRNGRGWAPLSAQESGHQDDGQISLQVPSVGKWEEKRNVGFRS